MKKYVLVMVPCADEMRSKLLALFGDSYEFMFANSCEETTMQQLQQAEIIIGEPTKEQLLQAENLKFLQMTWAGADRYTTMAEFPEGVELANASGAFGVVIAEYVLGSILSQYRHFTTYWERQRNHVWMESLDEETIIGKRVLILGTGDVGSQIAKRIKAFGTYVIGLNRSGRAKDDTFDEVRAIQELDEQIAWADIVIGCLPGTGETIGLLNGERLEKMKKNALLVNVGRGSLISRPDLERLLVQGHLRGAVLDVFDVEPLPVESVLWTLENVMITPHIAGPTFGGDAYTTQRIWDICMENLRRYMEGEPRCHIVDRKEGY